MNTETNWKNPLPDVPAGAVARMLGEREDSPRSLRLARDIGAGIDELAKEYGQDWSTIAQHLLKGALAEVKAARSKKALRKSA